MFDGQIAMSNTTVYSAWFARGGDAVRLTLDVEAISTNAKIKIELWTKNSEDTGDGDNADAAATPTVKIERDTVGRTTVEWNKQEDSDVGIKELVRYKITVTDEVSSTDDEWVLFRMLDPVWFDNVKG